MCKCRALFQFEKDRKACDCDSIGEWQFKSFEKRLISNSRTLVAQGERATKEEQEFVRAGQQALQSAFIMRKRARAFPPQMHLKSFIGLPINHNFRMSSGVRQPDLRFM